MVTNFLQQLLGIAPAHARSSEQLDAARARTYSPEMEERARANGFRSAEEMMLWAQQRNRPTGGTIQGKKMPSGGGAPSTEAATAIHPRNILQHILSRWKSATGD